MKYHIHSKYSNIRSAIIRSGNLKKLLIESDLIYYNATSVICIHLREIARSEFEPVLNFIHISKSE